MSDWWLTPHRSYCMTADLAAFDRCIHTAERITERTTPGYKYNLQGDSIFSHSRSRSKENTRATALFNGFLHLDILPRHSVLLFTFHYNWKYLFGKNTLAYRTFAALKGHPKHLYGIFVSFLTSPSIAYDFCWLLMYNVYRTSFPLPGLCCNSNNIIPRLIVLWTVYFQIIGSSWFHRLDIRLSIYTTPHYGGKRAAGSSLSSMWCTATWKPICASCSWVRTRIAVQHRTLQDSDR